MLDKMINETLQNLPYFWEKILQIEAILKRKSEMQKQLVHDFCKNSPNQPHDGSEILLRLHFRRHYFW